MATPLRGIVMMDGITEEVCRRVARLQQLQLESHNQGGVQGELCIEM